MVQNETKIRENLLMETTNVTKLFIFDIFVILQKKTITRKFAMVKKLTSILFS